MGLYSKHCVFLLACLLTLSGAVLSLPNLPTSTLNINNAENGLANSTLAAVIPTFFSTIRSLPLDEPVLVQQYTLLLTLHVLGELSQKDFDEEQQSQTWRSLQHVSIDIIGPAMDVESPLAMRKYAIWGIYKAVQLMVGLNDFRPRNYELYWRGGLVGWVGFNSGTGSHLSIGNGTANGTSHGVQVGSFPVSPNTLPNATNVDPGTNRIAFTFELHGRTIGESNVFMTLFTGILKAAPYPNVERVQDFFVNSGSFNSYMSFKERADLGPEGPFFRYELLIELFTYLPLWIIAQTSGWTEAEMYASVDDKVVGGGLMKCRFRLGVGAAAGGDVVIS